MSETELHLPGLPESYYWHLGLDMDGDYAVEVYQRGRSYYQSDTLIAYSSVPNNFTSTDQLQEAIDKLARKINRGAAVLAAIKEKND